MNAYEDDSISEMIVSLSNFYSTLSNIFHWYLPVYCISFHGIGGHKVLGTYCYLRP